MSVNVGRSCMRLNLINSITDEIGEASQIVGVHKPEFFASVVLWIIGRFPLRG